MEIRALGTLVYGVTISQYSHQIFPFPPSIFLPSFPPSPPPSFLPSFLSSYLLSTFLPPFSPPSLSPFPFPLSSLPAFKLPAHCARHCAKGGGGGSVKESILHLYFYNIYQVHLGIWHCAKTLGTGDAAGSKTLLVPAPVGRSVWIECLQRERLAWGEVER